MIDRETIARIRAAMDDIADDLHDDILALCDEAARIAELEGVVKQAAEALKEAKPWVDHISLGPVERALTACRQTMEKPDA